MDALDKLTIETPEQTSLDYPLAGLGSRFLALALDSLIQFVAAMVLLVLWLLLAAAGLAFPQVSTWFAAALLLLLFLLYYGYFAFFEAIWNGQSPGKRYTRLRVIKDSGRPINPYEAIARNLLRLVDQLPGIYAVGILSMLISPRNKRLGDWVAGTVVVHEKPFEGMKFALELPEETAAPVTPDARLSLEEFELVETFLQRREALAPDVRLRTAEQIAERLRAKLGLSQEQQGPETFLEAVARAHRRAARYR